MPARLPLAVLLAGALVLGACDATGSDADRVTGVWEGTIPFRVDTVLAEHNYRLKGDYDVRVRFDLLHDDGLVWGTVTAAFDGFLIAREAGRQADTLRFSPAQTLVSRAYGTWIRPELEIDVPWGPYSPDLWTFNKVGNRLDLQGKVEHMWSFPVLNTPEPGPFTFTLPMSARSQRFTRTGDTPVIPDSVMTPLGPGAGPSHDLLSLTGREHRAVLDRMRPRE